jgi:hypothetical protein
VKCAAVDSRSACMSPVTVVGVVHMHMRRVAARGSMDAAIGNDWTMGDPGRPRDLEGQHGEQEQQNETSHSV